MGSKSHVEEQQKAFQWGSFPLGKPSIPRSHSTNSPCSAGRASKPKGQSSTMQSSWEGQRVLLCRGLSPPEMAFPVLVHPPPPCPAC